MYAAGFIYVRLQDIKAKSKEVEVHHTHLMFPCDLYLNCVFCTFIDIAENKTKIVTSAGKYKLNVSRKKLKFTSKIIISKFIDDIKTQIKNGTVLIEIYGPIKQKKGVIKKFISSLKRNKLLIKSLSVKCFNGCRPKKKKERNKKDFEFLNN